MTIYIGQASLAREIEPNGRNRCGYQPVGESDLVPRLQLFAEILRRILLP